MGASEPLVRLPWWVGGVGLQRELGRVGHGGAGLEEEAWLFPLSGSSGAGNEVLMPLMGRDKQWDQSMSTIAGQRESTQWGWRTGGLWGEVDPPPPGHLSVFGYMPSLPSPLVSFRTMTVYES